jgi:hypothetical protein
MIAAERERLRVGERLLKAAGELVHAHGDLHFKLDVRFVGTNVSPFKGLRALRLG